MTQYKFNSEYLSLSDFPDFQVTRFALSYPFYSHLHQFPAL